MDTVSIIILAVVLLFTVIGLIVGLVKGFKQVNTWGGEYILAALATIGIGAILKKAEVPVKIASIVMLSVALLTLLLFFLLSTLIKKSISRSFEKREDDMRKLGGVGVINRIFGGISLMFKGLVISSAILVSALVVLDLSHIAAVKDALQGVYQGKFWLWFKPFIFDFIIIGIIHLAVRHGYSSGISSALWKLIVFALAIGAAFMAYGLVFRTEIFVSASDALSGKVSGWMSQFPVSEGATLNIAKWIITAGIFGLLLIVVAVVSFFVSRVLTFARVGSTFYVVDGVIGVILSIIITLGVMLFIGSIIAPVSDLEFMAPFTEYFTTSKFATYFYNDNLLLAFGMKPLIPLRDWLS